jgi:hypothetical protein
MKHQSTAQIIYAENRVSYIVFYRYQLGSYPVLLLYYHVYRMSFKLAPHCCVFESLTGTLDPVM